MRAERDLGGRYMYVLVNTLQQFTQAVKAGAAVRLNNLGTWQIDGWFLGLLRWIFAFFQPLVVTLIPQFITLLDRIEQLPVRFGGSQHIDYQEYLAAGEALLERLALCKRHQANLLRWQLERRLVALRYRSELCQPGKFNEDLAMRLEQSAACWKAKQEIFRYQAITPYDSTKLNEVARYADFGQLLIEDRDLREQFFAYALRDCLDVDFFIQYPALQKKLFESNLQNRIGRMGSDLLKIEKVPVGHLRGVTEKIVTLPFEGQPQNILDPASIIHFRGSYKLTIIEIFEIFRSKNLAVGNLEFMAEGIINWNVHKLGWWNADEGNYEIVPLINNNWWKPLPIFEVISKEEAQERYGNHLNGTVWNASATSTRGNANLDYDKSHAYLEMAIPIDGQNYAIYDFGKVATRFPKNFIETMFMVCNTVHATVAYPDENVFYTHRQHAQHSFALNRREGLKLLDLIRLDLIKARAGNFVYQIESENCAKWLHEKLEGTIGKLYNMFVMRLLDTEPIGMLKWLFATIKRLPARIQIPALTAAHLLFGAAQKIWIMENNQFVCHSLSTHRFWETGEVFLPAYLHHQLENGAFGLVALFSKPTNTAGSRYGFNALKQGLALCRHIYKFVDSGLYCLEFLRNVLKGNITDLGLIRLHTHSRNSYGNQYSLQLAMSARS